MLRLFVAIELPEHVQAVLRKAQADLARHSLAVRWVDPAGAHLTLKFLGAAEPEQVAAITSAMQQVAHHHQPFTLLTDELGSFPNARAPRVLWLGLAGAHAQLAALRDEVEQRIAPLGFPTEKRPFNPHLTLGRTYKDATRGDVAAISKTLTATAAPGATGWDVRAISLMRSDLGPDGARYTCITLEQLHTPH